MYPSQHGAVAVAHQEPTTSCIHQGTFSPARLPTLWGG